MKNECKKDENTIAFFDFDGTITRKDSFFLFLKFVLKNKFYIKLIINLPILICYKLNLLSNAKAKELVLKLCIKNMEEKELDSKMEDFTLVLETICMQSALEKIKWHKNNNHEVVIVSASLELYLKKLAKKLGMELIATKLKIKNGKITGELGSPNCYGEEKVKRIKEKYDLNLYSSIYAYGDSKGDKEMLKITSPNKAFYRVFS